MRNEFKMLLIPILLLSAIGAVAQTAAADGHARAAQENGITTVAMVAPPQLNPDVDKLIRTILNWGVEGMNTPGANVELRPGEPLKKNGVVYDIFVPYASGLPTDQSYAIFQWPINRDEPHVTYPEVYIAPDGRLCLQAGKCHDEIGPYMQLGLLAARGEPFRMSIISKDGKSKVAVLLIPHPITGSDATCNVEVIRATPRFEVAIIRGKGFLANERIEYTSNSADEIVRAPVNADANGNFNLVMAPFVKGKNKGTDEITFKGEGCAPKVAYHWGTID
jgi:hypothetical protein